MSDEIKKEISGRIKILREHFSMSPTAFAKETGVEPQTIRDYENGKSIPGGLFLRNLSQLGLNVEWLLTGAGSFNHTGVEFTDKKHIQKIHLAINDLKEASSNYYKEANKNFENKGNDIGEPQEDFLNNSTDTIYIEHYINVRGSAGPGQEVVEENHEDAIVKVRMDSHILRERVGGNFKSLKVASVSGDSMEPTLSHGDQVLVDTACDRFIEDAIYAIQQNGHLRFKRIKLKLDGSIIVKSDNPIDNDPEIYSAEEAEHFKVIGRVIPYKFGKFKI